MWGKNWKVKGETYYHMFDNTKQVRRGWLADKVRRGRAVARGWDAVVKRTQNCRLWNLIRRGFAWKINCSFPSTDAAWPAEFLLQFVFCSKFPEISITSGQGSEEAFDTLVAIIKGAEYRNCEIKLKLYKTLMKPHLEVLCSVLVTQLQERCHSAGKSKEKIYQDLARTPGTEF